MPINRRTNNTAQYDVLIVGGGPSGLHAALLLATMDVSVRIIEKKPLKSTTNSSVLLSPHTIQYLHAMGLADILVEKKGGMRHWRFQTYVNEGTTSIERQSYRVWEKKGAEFNWAMSVDPDDLVQVLHDALLERTDIKVDYSHELIDIQDMIIDAHGNIDYPVIATIKNHSSGHTFCTRSRVIIGADGAESFVRRKLGCTRQSLRPAFGNFYTLHVEPEGSFPGFRALSIVRKHNDAVMLIGHLKELYVVLEEKSDWRRFALLDNDSQLLEAIEAHVQSILQPYDIKFNKVLSFRRWKANDGISDKWTLHRRYFLVGSAAQRISPAELLSANLGFDSVQNLCWKLALCLKHFASPHILDTYETELASHAKDYHAVSDALLSLLSPDEYKLSKVNTGDEDKESTSSSSTAEQRMKRCNSWFIGATAYPTSNIGWKSTVALSGKLKPYTAQQLRAPAAVRVSRSLSSSSSADVSSMSRLVSQTSVLSRSKSVSMLHLRQQSLSATYTGAPIISSSNNTPASSSWVLRKPIFRSKTKVQTRGYQHYEPDSVVVAPHMDRWRLIRANQHSLFDRIVTERSPGAFTLVVFCTGIPSCQRALQALGQYLDSPSSIMQYECTVSQTAASVPGLRPTFRPTSQDSSNRSSHRFSSSSGSSAFGSRLSRFFSSWSASSTTAVSSEGSGRRPIPPPPNGAAVAPAPIILAKPHSEHRCRDGKVQETQFRLFSVMYITSSSRQQANQFFSEATPDTVRSMFPRGLDRVYFDHDNQTHSLYNISDPTVLVIRPDDYIGARIKIPEQVERLSTYFDAFLVPPVDMNSAAADVAADFCF